MINPELILKSNKGILKKSSERVLGRKFVKCDLCGSKRSKKIVDDRGYSILERQSCKLIYVGNPPSDEERKKFIILKKSLQKNQKKREKIKLKFN